jgi:hypothetical protein
MSRARNARQNGRTGSTTPTTITHEAGGQQHGGTATPRQPQVQERLYGAQKRLTVLQALLMWQDTAHSFPMDMDTFWAGVEDLVSEALGDVNALSAALNTHHDEMDWAGTPCRPPLLAPAPEVH